MPSQPRPPALLFGILGTVIEGLVLVGWALWMVISRPSAEVGGLPYGIAMALTLLAFAALLGMGVRALWQAMRWGRGPIITWQLLQGITVATMWGLLPIPVAVGALVLSVVVTVALLTPRALAASARVIGPEAPEASDQSD